MKNANVKNILASALTLCLFVLPLAAVNRTYGEEEGKPVAPGSEIAAKELMTDGSRLLKGEALVKSGADDQRLLVTVEGRDVLLLISDETLIIDTKTGLPGSLKDVKAKDLVYVYYSAAMTKSLPPQSQAIALITGVEPGKTHAELFTVREIVSRGSGEVRALNTEAGLIASFHKETALSPYKTKQIVSVEDIKVGTRLFIWYDIVAMSYPGQTGATRAVLIGQEEGLGVRAVYTPMAGAASAKLTIAGKELAFTDRVPEDAKGRLMVPLRACADQLGFKLTWDGDTKSVHMDNGVVNTTLQIGDDSYFKASSQAIGLTQPFSLGAAPALIEGNTYVPAALFNLLYSDNDAVMLN